MSFLKCLADQQSSFSAQVMGALKEHQIDKNTLVVFTSDNGAWYIPGPTEAGVVGPFQGTYAPKTFGYVDTGKGSTWEGGFRVSCLIHFHFSFFRKCASCTSRLRSGYEGMTNHSWKLPTDHLTNTINLQLTCSKMFCQVMHVHDDVSLHGCQKTLV